MIRLELVTPQGDLVTADIYNRLFTIHGVIMVWFFLIPSIPTMLGNFLVPLMIGARDLAFPAAEPGELVPVHARRRASRSTRCSPAASTPAGPSTRRTATHVLQHATSCSTAVGVFIAGFSSILTGLNFIVTIHTMRAPGLTWFRLPLFIWSLYATSIILVLATPVLAITLLLVALERLFGIGIFDPGARRRSAAVPAPVLVLLAPGRLHHDPARHGRGERAHPVLLAQGRSSATGSSRLSSIAIAVLGFLVWGHHMFVSGQSVYAGLVFSFLSFLVAVPSAIKVFNWTATLYKGSITLRHADALCARLHRPVHDRRLDRAVPRLRSPSTSTSPTPISSSPTSTTSWSAAR